MEEVGAMNDPLSTFWAFSPLDVCQRLTTTPQGISSEEAHKRLQHFGPSVLKPKKRSDTPYLLLSQFKAPIVLMLVFAAVLSLFLHDPADASIILLIVLASGLLGFWQEKGAADAVEKLLALVSVRATVFRDGVRK